MSNYYCTNVLGFTISINFNERSRATNSWKSNHIRNTNTLWHKCYFYLCLYIRLQGYIDPRIDIPFLHFFYNIIENKKNDIFIISKLFKAIIISE